MIFKSGRPRQAKSTDGGTGEAPDRAAAGPAAGPAAADAAGAPGRAVTPRAVAHPAGPAEVTRPGPASGDPMADDLIRRVMAAIDGWIRANGLTALPPHIAFEQALSILNAMDRSFPAGDRE